ncbi:MAG: phenylalanine 4-monooxygenase [Bdellovibrionales bacterium]|nr:phenylalanine 4-monooxygenase [Bdellovibrionales bacterium]
MDARLLQHPMVTTEDAAVYSDFEHETWAILFARQKQLLPQYAAPEVLEGMKILDIREDKIPNFSWINEILERETNFRVVPVKGFIPEKLFFEFLSQRCFPTTCFIRKREQLEYLVEPDVFHDVFGHVPLLVNPIFANFMQEFGKKGLESIEHDLYRYAAALYWFTVEFGLIQTAKGIKVYGAGITSSIGETQYSIDSDKPNRLKFNMIRAMKTLYRIDHFQESYFVIQDYQELFDTLLHMDWQKLKLIIDSFPDIDEGVVRSDDELMQEG